MERKLVVAAAAIGLVTMAGCGGPSDSQPAVSAPAAGERVGEFRIVEEGAVDGPGVSIAGALTADTTDPLLVNGVLLEDADGVVWLCSSLLESSPPGCAEPKLRVTNFPRESGDLDPANADVTGLQEDGGVVWIESYQLFGVAEPGL